MWQRFTEGARRVILLGQEEASKMNSGHVGTEHLLLGLVRENEGVAANVLTKMGVSLQKVRAEIEGEVSLGNDPISGEPKLTPKAERVLELAADEARRMRHNYIGTEHLLLALLREKDGLAATVLRRLGLNLEKARVQVLEYLASDREAAAQTASGAIEQFRVAPAVRELLQSAGENSATPIEIVDLLRAFCQPGSESARQLEQAGVDVEALRARLQP